MAAEREKGGKEYRGSQEKATFPGSQFTALCWRGADSARRALLPEKTWTRAPHDCTTDLRNDSARVGSKAFGTESDMEDGENPRVAAGSGDSTDPASLAASTRGARSSCPQIELDANALCAGLRSGKRVTHEF